MSARQERLLAEAHAKGVAEGRAQERKAQAEYEAKREREHPEFGAGIRIDLAQPGAGVVAIRIPVAHAADLQNSLSDFLCWARGYRAALQPDDYDRLPMGVEEIREINIALKKALGGAEQAKEKT